MTSMLRNRIVVIVLLLLASVATGFQLLPESQPRVVGERFVQALWGQSDARAEAYLAPDAQVFLQGASSSLSRAQFQAYLEQLKRNRQAFRAASPVYSTDTGAAWLLEIEYLADAAIANPSGTGLPPQLWMQARIEGNQITRVWIHFTVEALSRMHVTPDVYRTAAEVQGVPVPEAWSEGTPAMVLAAQRATDRADGGWSESRRQALILAAWLPLALVIVVAVARRYPRHREPRRMPDGRLIAGLGELRSPGSRPH